MPNPRDFKVPLYTNQPPKNHRYRGMIPGLQTAKGEKGFQGFRVSGFTVFRGCLEGLGFSV